LNPATILNTLSELVFRKCCLDFLEYYITHNQQAVNNGDLPAELLYNADQVYIDGVYTGLRFDKNKLNRFS
jgi:hypothetical protein